MFKMYFLVLVLVLVFLFFDVDKKDNFSALGALQQLNAIDNQDLYLISDAEKYIYPKYYGGWNWKLPYRFSPWNEPTRLDKDFYYPTYGIYPPLYP